jgi:cell division transport system permease protein
MKLGFFLKESLRSMKRNPIPSFAAMASVLVTLLVLGVFIPIVQATTGAANDVRDKVALEVYLKNDATNKQVEHVRQLITGNKDVQSVTYVSKEQAYKRESKRNPEAYELLGSNPLPDSFRITPKNPDDIDAIRNALAPTTPSGGRTVVDPAIDEVKNRKEETDKILTATSVVKLAMVLLCGLLIVASALLVSNTIRLSLFSRRREVEVMKLVGATDWFIRWPFVLEAIILGAIGGVLAILMLLVGKIAFVDPLASDFALISAPKTMSLPLLGLLLMIAAVGVSALGSGLSLRRFLKV